MSQTTECGGQLGNVRTTPVIRMRFEELVHNKQQRFAGGDCGVRDVEKPTQDQDVLSTIGSTVTEMLSGTKPPTT